MRTLGRQGWENLRRSIYWIIPSFDPLTAYPSPLALDSRKTSINSNEKWEIWINFQFIILFSFYTCIFRRIVKLKSRCWRCENEKYTYVHTFKCHREWNSLAFIFPWKLKFIHLHYFNYSNEWNTVDSDWCWYRPSIQKNGFHFNSTSDKEYISL